jgi:DNA-binding XRE family transcriptional regulator
MSMGSTLREKLATIEPTRRAEIDAQADRLHAEYLTLKELRRAQELTQSQLAENLGIRQATVAKYERQSDLLLSTLSTYVRAMGGSLRLVVEFPGKAPVTISTLGETNEPQMPRGRRKNSR